MHPTHTRNSGKTKRQSNNIANTWYIPYIVHTTSAFYQRHSLLCTPRLAARGHSTTQSFWSAAAARGPTAKKLKKSGDALYARLDYLSIYLYIPRYRGTRFYARLGYRGEFTLAGHSGVQRVKRQKGVLRTPRLARRGFFFSHSELLECSEGRGSKGACTPFASVLVRLY